MHVHTSRDDRVRMTNPIWWPHDGSDEWLGRTDGLLAVRLLQQMTPDRADPMSRLDPVLEVGVWKGAWTSVVLMNTPSVRLFGVDPYPNLGHVRDLMRSRLTGLGLTPRFDLLETLEQLPSSQRYSMIHLDGEHSERAVTHELEFASTHLAEGGVIVVDDVRNFWFPGIAAALYHNLERLGLRIFATSHSKAYVSTTAHSDRYYKMAADICTKSALNSWTAYEGWGDTVPYPNSTVVLDQPVLLIGDRQTEQSRASRLAHDLLPPAIVRRLVRLRRRLQPMIGA